MSKEPKIEKAHLKIALREPDASYLRLLPQNLIVTLNDQELPTFYDLHLNIKADDVVTATIALYPTQIEVEADVLARLFCQNPTCATV